MTATIPYSMENRRVWVAGEHGMVGSAIVRRLASEKCEILHLARRSIDFRDQGTTSAWIRDNRPDVVFLAAAKVGGIAANASSPASFLYDNLIIEANIVHAAYQAGVERLMFFGSTCIYPKLAIQPIPEEALLTGPLEETNQWYAIAKIAGIKMIEAYRKQYGVSYISCQPTNLYGPGDNYDLETSHVLPALMRKAHVAKEEYKPSMTVWGSGQPLREFLHVDDLADASVFLTKYYDGVLPINVGSGEEVTIATLARLIAQAVGYTGQITFDATRPDGTPRKLADTRRLKQLGWDRARSLAQGLRDTYAAWQS